MQTLTPDQQKTTDAFTITRHSGGHVNITYTVTRTDPTVPWPTEAALLKICDDGWHSFFAGERPCHFGGVVSPITENSTTTTVTVYID